MNCGRVSFSWFVVHNVSWEFWWGNVLGECILEHNNVYGPVLVGG